MPIGFCAVVACAIVAAIASAPAHATFPGHNGKIAFVNDGGVWTVNPDGSDEFRTPAVVFNSTYDWSPDGTKIAYTKDEDLHVVNADGTAETSITNTDLVRERDPSWSPDGTRIAYERHTATSEDVWIADADGTNNVRLPTSGRATEPQWHVDGLHIIHGRCFTESCSDARPWIIKLDGTGEAPLPVANDALGDWSPDGSQVVFERVPPGASHPNRDIYIQNLDGSGLTNLTAENPGPDREPTWSPDGTKVYFRSTRDGDIGPYVYAMNADGSGVTRVVTRQGLQPQVQPIPVNSYPRPKGATPLQVYLVPAYEPCTAPNRTHGPPLAFGSCNPPTSVSEVTVGTADANGRAANSVSFVRYLALAGNPATPADEADVRIEASITDVYDRATLDDYGGALGVSAPLQITDKLNTPHPGGPGAGTVTQAALGFPVSCAPTADTTVGATCALTTTFEALAPGAVPEGRRSIWQLGQVEVRDSGDQPFLRQGIFVP